MNAAKEEALRKAIDAVRTQFSDIPGPGDDGDWQAAFANAYRDVLVTIQLLATPLLESPEREHLASLTVEPARMDQVYQVLPELRVLVFDIEEALDTEPVAPSLVALRTVSPKSSDRHLMEKAIEEMRLATADPKVGAVLANRAGDIVATGYRTDSGVHAERSALENAGRPHNGALTLYTTLEPCTGTKSECAGAIIRAGIQTVVIGRYDLHPDIYRKGWAVLSEAGIELRDFDADLRQRCDDVNSASVLNYSTKIGPVNHGRYSYTTNGAGGKLTVRFSESDSRFIDLRFSQRSHDSVYAVGGGGVDVALATGATRLSQVDDPGALGGFSHSARVGQGEVAVFLSDEGAVLVRIKKVDSASNAITYELEVVAFE